MMHYKRRLIPVNLLDIPAVETWLADLAEKGLFLVSSGNYFAKFETAEPAKVTYRLEVTANPFLRADPDNKKILFFQEFGWKYVCTFGNYFHVYRSELENPPEIHTDPKQQAQAFARICLAQAFAAMLLFGMLFYTLHSGILSLANIVKLGLPILFALLFWISLPIVCAAQSFRLYRIYRRLKNGAHLEHSSDYRNRLPLRYLQRIVPMTAFIIILASVYGLTIINNKSEQLEIPESFPLVSLAEIEQDPAFQNGHIDDANTTYVSGDVDNEIRFRRSFLAPEQTTITQSGFVPGRNWAGSSDPYEPTLAFHIYRLRCPSMGGRFVESQMDWELSDLMPWDTIDLSAETGLDEAYLCVSGKYSDALKKLFLRQGDTIIYVSYFGEADLRPFVPQFAALMQETYPTRKPQ